MPNDIKYKRWRSLRHLNQGDKNKIKTMAFHSDMVSLLSQGGGCLGSYAVTGPAKRAAFR